MRASARFYQCTGGVGDISVDVGVDCRWSGRVRACPRGPCAGHPQAWRDDDEALRTASANLARTPCQVRRSGPMALVQGSDGYVSSWLAAPAALAAVAADIGRRVIAVAVTRDQLILIDADHPDAAARMLEPTLQHDQTAARQLSRVPYLITEAGIEPWEPRPATRPGRSSARPSGTWPPSNTASRRPRSTTFSLRRARTSTSPRTHLCNGQTGRCGPARYGSSK
jgi:hypothetical protein